MQSEATRLGDASGAPGRKKSPFCDQDVSRSADYFRRGTRHRARRRLTIAGIALLVAAPLAVAACRHAGVALVRTVPVSDPDAIVVLASHERARLAEARRMALRYRRARVLLTTPNHPIETPATKGDGRVEWLVQNGVRRDRIHVIPALARNTRDEARTVASELARSGGRQLLIVTSAYHTRRAIAVFRSQLRGAAVSVGIQPAPSGVRPARWWTRRYDRLYVAYEWAAIGTYALRYRIWS